MDDDGFTFPTLPAAPKVSSVCALLLRGQQQFFMQSLLLFTMELSTATLVAALQLPLTAQSTVVHTSKAGTGGISTSKPTQVRDAVGVVSACPCSTHAATPASYLQPPACSWHT
jgi:hypothetical protein